MPRQFVNVVVVVVFGIADADGDDFVVELVLVDHGHHADGPRGETSQIPAALQDPRLYELLALVDAIRDGRAREREIAVRELTSRIDLEP